jgi:apolipoprotein N-acyltransferase
MRIHDRRAWLWLLAGAALLPFTQFQTVLPLAAWLAPIFLLRFARARPALLAVPILMLVHYTAAVVALRGIFPAQELYLFGLAGVMGILPYAADLAVARRLSGLARTLVFPAAAVTFDWLFGLSSLGTLGSTAYAQFGDVPLTQLVSVTGIWGLTFLMSWLAPVANELWERGLNWRAARYSLVPFACLILGAALLGSARVAFGASAAPIVRVAGLAADRALWHGLTVPRWSDLAIASDAVRAAARAQFAPILDDLLDRSREQARAGAKIVAWSEAAGFALKEDEPALLARARNLAQAEGIYLQISVVFALRTDHYPFAENRTILIDPRGQVAWDYYKAIHPLGDANIFAPGPGVIPTVDTPYGRLATVICFDADFPALIRQAGQARADILIVPANDWQPIDVMHARVATFRAVENGVALMRPTGNGVSIAVDSLGQQLAAADYFVSDKLTMVANLPTRGVATLYATIGDSLAYLCAGALAALTGLAFVRRPGVRVAAQQPAYKQYN